MRWLLWLLLILAAVIGVSMLTASNEGYVLIVRPPYRMELSFNLLLLLMLLVFLLMHYLLRFVQFARRLPASVKQKKEHNRIKQGHAALIESLHAIEKGDDQLAEKAAANALSLGEDAGLSAIIAARAAHKLGQFEKRDFYLAEAERLAPDASIARLLTQAELWLDEGRYQEVLSITSDIEALVPAHPKAQRLAQKAQRKLAASKNEA